MRHPLGGGAPEFGTIQKVLPVIQREERWELYRFTWKELDHRPVIW